MRRHLDLPPHVELSWNATVQREVVHRAAVSEVFITDHRSIGENRFVVAAQLPRAHVYYGDDVEVPWPERHFDPILLLECCRQAGVLISHKYYGIPPTWAFVFRKADLKIADTSATEIGSQPGRLQIMIHFEKRYLNGESVTGATLALSVYIDDRWVGDFTGSLSFLPRPMYDAFRTATREQIPQIAGPTVLERLPVEVNPAHAGRTRSDNVVIAWANDDTLVVVEKSDHASMCDHQVDHVSGMTMIEAARQAAFVIDALDSHGPRSRLMTRFVSTFKQFAERDHPVFCSVRRMDPAGNRDERDFAVTMTQNGGAVAEFMVRIEDRVRAVSTTGGTASQGAA